MFCFFWYVAHSEQELPHGSHCDLHGLRAVKGITHDLQGSKK